MVEKLKNWLDNKIENNELNSLRVRLTYLIFLMLSAMLYGTFDVLNNFINKAEQKDLIITPVCHLLETFFGYTTFVFIIILLLYVLKKTNFNIKLGFGLVDFSTSSSNDSDKIKEHISGVISSTNTPIINIPFSNQNNSTTTINNQKKY